MEKKLEGIIARYHENEGNLISILQDLESEFGYLREDAIIWISERLDVPPAKFYGIATFYAQFHLKPRGQERHHRLLRHGLPRQGVRAADQQPGKRTGHSRRRGHVGRPQVHRGKGELRRRLQHRAGHHRQQDRARQDDAGQAHERDEDPQRGEAGVHRLYLKDRVSEPF